MLTEITLKDAIGKTLQRFESSLTINQSILIFSDGTFTTIETKTNRYDLDESDTTIGPGQLNLFAFGDDTLIQANILTSAELETRRTQRDEDYRRAREVKERQLLKQLTEKYTH